MTRLDLANQAGGRAVMMKCIFDPRVTTKPA